MRTALPSLVVVAVVCLVVFSSAPLIESRHLKSSGTTGGNNDLPSSSTQHTSLPTATPTATPTGGDTISNTLLQPGEGNMGNKELGSLGYSFAGTTRCARPKTSPGSRAVDAKAAQQALAQHFRDLSLSQTVLLRPSTDGNSFNMYLKSNQLFYKTTQAHSNHSTNIEAASGDDLFIGKPYIPTDLVNPMADAVESGDPSQPNPDLTATGASDLQGVQEAAGVLGGQITDGRTKVRNTRAYPYAAVGQLVAPDPERGNQGYVDTCTCAAIGAYHCLTAAHCVYSVSAQQPLQHSKFYPGRAGVASQEVVKVKHSRILKAFSECTDYSSCGIASDFAMVTFEEPLQVTRTGFFGFGYNDKATTIRVRTAGYPGDKPYGSMWEETCTTPGQDYTANPNPSTCFVASGQSGSPMWVTTSTGGAEIREIFVASSASSSWATLFNKQVVDIIKAWLKEDNAQGAVEGKNIQLKRTPITYTSEQLNASTGVANVNRTAPGNVTATPTAGSTQIPDPISTLGSRTSDPTSPPTRRTSAAYPTSTSVLTPTTALSGSTTKSSTDAPTLSPTSSHPQPSTTAPAGVTTNHP